LRQVRYVGESDIVCHLLLDRQASVGIILWPSNLRIDFDAADAEEFLRAIAYRGIQGLAQDCIAG
jgi:hypothetical protein